MRRGARERQVGAARVDALQRRRHRDLHIEDGRLGLADRLSRAHANRPQSLDCTIHGLLQSREFARNLVVADNAHRDVGDLPAQQVRGANDNAGRSRNAVQFSWH